ncbi:hypothetical protein [uncultured Megamonas sp.]|uniref:hypothetical protein n=1 Tax=uncultured Megamonas sp. TaxID=286140 RepID=UPI00259B1369|nr:hypothetical protein [uncultured Megamonas sp.]
MWIRIRNKEALVYANNFYIRANEVEEKYGISYFDGDSFVNLGFYKSKERAIEVLDEIQNKIEGKRVLIDAYGDIKIKKKDNNKVYQMPEE